MQAQESISAAVIRRRQTAFLLATATLLAVFLTLLCCGNLGAQTDVFYLGGRDFQADALNTEEYARTLDPYDYAHLETRTPFKDGNYPPLAYVLFYVMDVVSGRDAATPWALFVSVACSALGAASLVHACFLLTGAQKRRRIGIAAAMLLSGPMLFAFERGNLILLAAALCGYFLAGYRSARPVVRELAYLALAVAAALKIFPALLGLLLLYERRWRDAVRLVLYGIVAVFAPFLLLNGGFANLPLLFSNFGAHTAYYTKLLYPRFGLRLYAALLRDAPWASEWMVRHAWKLGDKLLLVIPYVDALLSCGCALTALTARRDWQRVLALLLIVVNYPVNSGLYTALYLLPALALFLSCGERARGDRLVLAALIAVLSPVQLPFPPSLLQADESMLCSLSDILRNLAAYALFAAFGVQGFVNMLHKSAARASSATTVSEKSASAAQTESR